MKNPSKKIIVFLLGLLIATFMGTMALGAVDTALVAGGDVVKFWPVIPVIKMATSLAPQKYQWSLPEGSLGVAAIASIFSKDLEEKIFPDNSFYKRSVDDTPMIVSQGNGQTVVTGTAGSNPNVEIDRAVLPATITKRTDDSNNYDLAEFTTDPQLIQVTDELVVRYDKRQSILRNHILTLETKICDYFANIWLPNGVDNIVRTTGSTTRTASAPSATGTRKRIAKEDFLKVRQIFNNMSLPSSGRNIVLPADMESDLWTISEFIEAQKLGLGVIPNGLVGRLLGFDIWVRPTVGVYDNTGTPVKKAFGAAGAAADNMAALAWHESFVNRAEGDRQVFINEGKAEYYGTVLSAMVRAGGKIRKDKVGVVALVEAA